MYAKLARLTGRNIRRQRKRTVLTLIGIVIGITAVVALIGLGQGLEDAVAAEFETLGADKVYIWPGGDFLGMVVEMDSTLADRDLDVIERSRGIDRASGMFYDYTPIQFRGDTVLGPVVGMPTDSTQQMVMDANSFAIDDGRNIRATDRTNVVIGKRLAESVFDRPVRLRNQITVRGEQMRVVGVMERTGDPEYDRSVVMPLTEARSLLGRDDELTWIVAEVAAGFDPEEAADQIERMMRQDRNLPVGEEDFTVATADDVLELFGSIMGVIQAVVLGIASISLLVGGVGIMNTMYTAVTERTREIGIMKAIGATDEHIRTLFLIESATIGLIGGATGIALGYGLTAGIAYTASTYAAFPITVSFSPLLIGGALLFSTGVGVFAGVFPARRAAKMDPVDALRYE